MKIIEAKNLEINRAATIDAQAIKIVKKFNSLLKNKSFDGLSEINKSLSLADYKNLKVNKNEIKIVETDRIRAFKNSIKKDEIKSNEREKINQ